MEKNNEHELKADVVRKNLDYLVRFAFFRTGDRASAEDMVHDAIVRFLEHRQPPIAPENMRAYLFRIVCNLCNAYRKDRVEKALDTVDMPEETESDRLDCEEAERINALLDAIPEHQSDVIRMNVVDGLSFAEISRIISVPVSTLKSRYKTGMDRLKNMYLKNERQWKITTR